MSFRVFWRVSLAAALVTAAVAWVIPGTGRAMSWPPAPKGTQGCVAPVPRPKQPSPAPGCGSGPHHSPGSATTVVLKRPPLIVFVARAR